MSILKVSRRVIAYVFAALIGFSFALMPIRIGVRDCE